MSDTRSPSYPSMPLSEAISKARMIYSKEHMSPMTPEVAAEAMGYKGVSGASLAAIATLKKYGLLDGRSNDLRLTKDAQILAIDTPESSDYHGAINRTALKPDIFLELHKQFLGVGSERNIGIYLEKQGFKPNAASTIAKNYKENLGLMGGKPMGQHLPAPDNQDDMTQAPDTDASPIPARGTPGVFSVTTTRLRTAKQAETIGTATAPFRITMDGNKLHIEANVDLKGLQLFKQVLDNYENMLKLLTADLSQAPHIPEESEDENDAVD